MKKEKSKLIGKEISDVLMKHGMSGLGMGDIENMLLDSVAPMIEKILWMPRWMSILVMKKWNNQKWKY